MICLTKLFQQKRRRIGYILAFSAPTISKRDSSEFVSLFVCYTNVYVFLIVSLNYIENIKTLVIDLNVKLDATDIVLLQLLGKVLWLTLYINKNI